MPVGRSRHLVGPRRVRVGFVELIDAAAVLVADAKGLFTAEGLDVVLCREIGWGNVRDKLLFGRLDAAATLIGTAVRAATGDEDESGGPPIRSIMALGTGGDAITLSEKLCRAGVSGAVSLGDYVLQSRGVGPLQLAHVFESSVHHYLLRQWLVDGGLDPDRDVKLCVLPPGQMARHLASGQVDGFCVGEPWNSHAEAIGAGRIVALTSDLLPHHPDKALAVNTQWADGHADTVAALVRALIRASRFCADASNTAELAGLLSRPDYLRVPEATVLRSLTLDGTAPGVARYAAERPKDWRMRTFDSTFPSQTHAAWLVTRMQQWGRAEGGLDPWAIAARATDSTVYRRAMADLGLPCPTTDTPPMRLRNDRLFDPPAAPRGKAEGVLV